MSLFQSCVFHSSVKLLQLDVEGGGKNHRAFLRFYCLFLCV